MTRTLFSINSSIVNVHSKPSLKSELESEALYGEKINLIESYKNWDYVLLKSDGSEGWIQKNYGLPFSNTHKVNTLITNVKSEAQVKSTDLHFLLYNSKVNVTEIIDNWAKIKLNSIKKGNFFGFVPLNHLDEVNTKHDSMYKQSQKFLNAPYKWGGKSCLGIDCSGLIQLIFNFTKCSFFPRNSKEQEKFSGKKVVNKNELKSDDLVFWNGHVGIMKNNIKLIHASAHKMYVVEEKLDDAIERIYKLYKLTPKYIRL